MARIPAAASSRRRSRRSPGSRSRTRSASRATCSSRSRSPARSSSTSRVRRGPPEGAALPPVHDGCRSRSSRRCSVRALDRTRGGRRLLFALSMLGRAVLVPRDGGPDRQRRALPARVRRASCCRRASRSRRARSCPRSSTTRTSSSSPTRASRSSPSSAARSSAPFAAAILKVLGRAVGVARRRRHLRPRRRSRRSASRARRRSGRPETADEREQLHAPSIVIAGTAMASAARRRRLLHVLRRVRAEDGARAGVGVRRGAHRRARSAAAIGTRARAAAAQEDPRGVDPRRCARSCPRSRSCSRRATYGRVSLVVAAARGRGLGRVRSRRVRQPAAARRRRRRARARVRAVRDALPARVGRRRACSRSLFPGGGRGGIFLVALVLLFAGLSYVGRACAALGRRRENRRRRRRPPELERPRWPSRSAPIALDELDAMLVADQRGFGGAAAPARRVAELGRGRARPHARRVRGRRRSSAHLAHVLVRADDAGRRDGARRRRVVGRGACPTHRRRGVLTQMIGALHDDARERGEPAAILTASESVDLRPLRLRHRDVAPRPVTPSGRACSSVDDRRRSGACAC